MSAAEDFDVVDESLRSLGGLGINVGHDLSTRWDREALDEEQAAGLAALERIRKSHAALREALVWTRDLCATEGFDEAVAKADAALGEPR